MDVYHQTIEINPKFNNTSNNCNLQNNDLKLWITSFFAK